jgi:hypothetical protein
VFDTFLTRVVGDPLWVFFILGQRLVTLGLISIRAQTFGQKREKAEHQAYQKGELLLGHNWYQLAADLGVTEESENLCMEEELNTEAAMIQPVPGGRQQVLRESERAKVAYVSDMYLRATFLEEQLRKHDL